MSKNIVYKRIVLRSYNLGTFVYDLNDSEIEFWNNATEEKKRFFQLNKVKDIEKEYKITKKFYYEIIEKPEHDWGLYFRPKDIREEE